MRIGTLIYEEANLRKVVRLVRLIFFCMTRLK